MKNTFIYDGQVFTRKQIETRNSEVLEVYRNNSNQRISECLKLVEGNEILDVGCNDGTISRCLAERGYTVTGIDVLQSMIEIAKEFNQVSGTVFEVRDFLKDPFPPQSFDCIIILETIEHVLDPTLYLREFHRILRSNGKLIISTPNATSLKNLLYALSYRKKSKQKKLVKDISSEPRATGTQLEHVYNWDLPTLVRLLNRNGFDVVYTKFLTAGPIVLPFFRKKIRLIKGNSKILDKFETLKSTQILKCRKRE